MGRSLCVVSRTLAVALVVLVASSAQAAADRFDYDPAGRLIRRIDDQSRGTDYVHDPAGNVLQVGAPGQALPPLITSGPLSDQRRNEVRQVAVGGSGLAGVSIKTSHPGVIVIGLVATATAASFRLAVSNLVPLGRQDLNFQTASGSVTLSFNVLPALGFVFVPEPISIAPDNIARKVSLFMSEPLLEARTFGLMTMSPVIAKPTITQINFAPGQTQADLGVIGVSQGTTVLRLSDSRLNEPVESMVFVNPGQATPMRLSKSVGVSRGLPGYVSPTSMTASAVVGIARGGPWNSASSAITSSGGIGIVRAIPWYASSSAIWNSSSVGIVRGTPWYASATTNPLVAPLVGIARP